ncbi:DUF2861 family protein [Veronia pacifica]|uniref:DUF2861 domain-containing protein n=1 Tax=Veronia pacifica TaxID=1080227 RepID=A0A1C3ED85_9GAMM|nr:DUF2861 family protein [Veronia pacifica]ODA31217.1 hypothetical protein A8L45_17810 [Veronia pacifica]
MNMRLTLALMIFLPVFSAQGDGWFYPSPLAKAYSALAENHPKLAWSELRQALNHDKIDKKHWLPLKNEIIDQSACGQTLKHGSSLPPAKITLSFIERIGILSPGYSITLSAEDVKVAFSVSLTSPDEQTLFVGEFPAIDGYQEIETGDMFRIPESGVYSLAIGKNKYVLIIALEASEKWLKIEGANKRLLVSPPDTTDNCMSAVTTWQWLSADFELLGVRIPILDVVNPLPAANDRPEGATRLTAATSHYEYQQGIKVKYTQRLSLPLTSLN